MCCLTRTNNCRNNYSCLYYLTCIMFCKDIKCCPDKKVLLKCCNICELTYWRFGIFHMLFTLGLYFFDIASDIIVLVDLKNTNSEYFNVCLVIILLPTFYALWVGNGTFSRILTILNTKGNDRCSRILYVFSGLFIYFLAIVLQYNVISSACFAAKTYSIDIRGYQLEYEDTRMAESLLESAPQSLFQLFLILKNINQHTYNQFVIYYLSISFSIFSLAFSLVSYEVVYYNNKRIKYLTMNLLESRGRLPTRDALFAIPVSVVEKWENSQNQNGVFDIRYKILKKNTPYIGLLFLYRLTEILSRIGLLAVIGNIYDGYFIMIFLLSDFFILTMANLYKIRLNTRSREASFCSLMLIKLDNESKNNINLSLSYKCKKYSKIFCKLFFTLRGIETCIIFLLTQLKNLAVFNNYFSYYIYNETYLYIEFDNYKSLRNKNLSREKLISRNKKIKDRRQKTFKMTLKNHFISRYLNNLCLSIVIIYNLSVNTYSQSLFIISISGMVCFVLNILFFGLITLYTRNYLKYDFMFSSIVCCKCCHCCKKTELNNKINTKIQKTNEEKKIELEDICGKKKEENHPDDIII